MSNPSISKVGVSISINEVMLQENIRALKIAIFLMELHNVQCTQRVRIAKWHSCVERSKGFVFCWEYVL